MNSIASHLTSRTEFRAPSVCLLASEGCRLRIAPQTYGRRNNKHMNEHEGYLQCGALERMCCVDVRCFLKTL